VKKLLIISLTLLVELNGFGQKTISKKELEKIQPIIKETLIDSVDFISIKKQLYATDSICFLNKEQIQTVIEELNNAEPKGKYKMIPKFWLTVYFKDGNKRVFKVSNGLIKSFNDWTYAFSNSELIDSLWKNAEEIPLPPKPPTTPVLPLNNH